MSGTSRPPGHCRRPPITAQLTPQPSLEPPAAPRTPPGVYPSQGSQLPKQTQGEAPQLSKRTILRTGSAAPTCIKPVIICSAAIQRLVSPTQPSTNQPSPSPRPPWERQLQDQISAHADSRNFNNPKTKCLWPCQSNSRPFG